MLDLLPGQRVKRQEGITGMRGLVPRQPTRKEQTHNPVGARLQRAAIRDRMDREC